MCNIFSDTNFTDPPSPCRVKPSPRQPIRVHLLYSNHGKKLFKFCPFVDVPCHSSHIRAGPFHKQAEAPGGRSLEKVGSPTSFCTESEFSLFFSIAFHIFFSEQHELQIYMARLLGLKFFGQQESNLINHTPPSCTALSVLHLDLK